MCIIHTDINIDFNCDVTCATRESEKYTFSRRRSKRVCERNEAQIVLQVKMAGGEAKATPRGTAGAAKPNNNKENAAHPRVTAAKAPTPRADAAAAAPSRTPAKYTPRVVQTKNPVFKRVSTAFVFLLFCLRAWRIDLQRPLHLRADHE
jgi:hypothetical protein